MATDCGRFGKVVVIFGGCSAEREVSLESGQAILSSLQRQGVDAFGFDLEAGLAGLCALEFDRAFIAVHGRGGEDGTLQGALELLGKPYTGSRVLASAIAMDKVATKRLWMSEGIPTPPFRVIERSERLPQVAAELGLPLIVKPTHEGSSIGMSRVEAAEDLVAACELAHRFDGDIFAERCIRGEEYTVGLLDGRALPVIGLRTSHTFYDYDAKYKSEDTRYLLPCGLPSVQEAELQALCERAAAVIDCRGWARIDVMMDEHGPWLLEINTVPGMTSHSLVPKAARAAGLDFDALVLRILESSL